jgi:hypothetical protein
MDAPQSIPAVPSSLPRIKFLPLKKPDESSKGPVGSEPMVDDMEETGKRTYCPIELRDQIVKPEESHLCAHPL